MTDDVGPGDIDTDVATAVGLLAIGDLSVPEAASAANISTWELEEAVESAGLAEQFGLNRDVDLGAQIDSMLDGES